MIEEQDDAERGNHLVEMVARIEMAEDEKFQEEPEGERREQRQHQRHQKIIEHAIKRHGEIGAEHILDAVCEIDEVHHAKDERQSRRDQK